VFTSEKGFTVVELLIALAIAGIVMGGLYSLAISSSRFYLAQNAAIGMQADARAALEFMARELRLARGTPTLSTTVTSNDTISFNHVEDSGYSSGLNTSTQLKDILKAWQASAFAPSATSAYTVTIIAGTGTGQARTITDNTATQLTVSSAWGTTPDTSSLYVITSNHAFTRTSSTDNVLRYRIGATGSNDPLAENITSLSFALPTPTSITISLTARTKSIDPTTNQYRYYSLTETVRKRNN
jgi:prepilin-type N-terminal cleavage/methylation domain-containing protein